MFILDLFLSSYYLKETNSFCDYSLVSCLFYGIVPFGGLCLLLRVSFAEDAVLLRYGSFHGTGSMGLFSEEVFASDVPSNGNANDNFVDVGESRAFRSAERSGIATYSNADWTDTHFTHGLGFPFPSAPLPFPFPRLPLLFPRLFSMVFLLFTFPITP